MEIEINASEYSSPAELAGAIQAKISQLYVDWVWVNFSGSRQKVTPNTAEHVCKGLLMADKLRRKWVDKKPDSIGWRWEWTGEISDAPEIRSKVSKLYVDFELVKGLRDQAAKDRESAANAKDYEAAARWDAWVGAFDHLLVAAAQDPQNTETP